MGAVLRRTLPGVPAAVMHTMQQVSSGDDALRVPAVARLTDMVRFATVPAETIVNVGALMHVEHFLAEPFNANRALQRNAVTLLTHLAVHDGRVNDARVQARFLANGLVGNLARHLRHPDQELARSASRALAWIAWRDRRAFTTKFDAAWHHDHGVLEALADNAKSDVGGGSTAFKTLTMMWPLDNAGAMDVTRAAPMLKGALQRTARDARNAAVVFHAFITVHGGNRAVPEVVVDSVVESGIVPRVVKFLAAANAGGRDDPYALRGSRALLSTVCSSDNKEHVQHVADSGLLETLPALLASDDDESYDAATTLLSALLAEGGVVTARRVLDAAPGVVPALVHRLCEADADAGAGSGARGERAARCLQALARTAAPLEAVRLYIAGAPLALVAASVAQNPRSGPRFLATLAVHLCAAVLVHYGVVAYAGLVMALYWLSPWAKGPAPAERPRDR
uniref:Uncharacterized protein n=1 Tax=Neobodo designis TaxID=312471 RepID=A0A6U4NUZ2_NEODS